MSAPAGLARLQAQFAAALAGEGDGVVAASLQGDPGLVSKRLDIYRRAIRAHCEAALRAAYPVVARLVGEGFFAEMARCHAAAFPPACGDLNRYGDSLPAFIASYPPAASLPWLGDVACLEWACHESAMAADVPGIDFAALAGIPDEGQPRLAFRLHPSVRRVRSAWPVLAIWDANQPGRDGTPGREEGADEILVWRGSDRVRAGPLAPPEAAFVDALIVGLALEEAADAAPGWDFAPMLARLAADGLLAEFRLA